MANITLRCADERLNDVIAKKFANDSVLSELGGVKWFLSRDSFEEIFEKIEFLLAHNEVNELHLVAETDCQLYQELGENDDDRYQEDILEAITQIESRFPELKIRGFLYNTHDKQLKKIDPSDS